jgi:hypothetical protein
VHTRVVGGAVAGHFQDFWAPVWNSTWLGGGSHFEDWMEIFPYVLQGYVGQAILTQVGTVKA